ncbi:MAG: ATP-binding protein [Desulforhabdus sp.]|jgi:signal transduction histidine kinase|nr:ATP-binding protein [Desulforhabdus sp.]
MDFLSPSVRKATPFFALLFFVAIALFLWREQVDHQRDLLLRNTETAAEQAKIRIEGLMKARIASLDILKARWIEREPPDFSQKRFLSFAAALFKHYPGFKAISWVSPDGTIRWVFPEDGGNNVAGRSMYQHPDPTYRTAFEQAHASRNLTITPCTELFHGGVGFEVIIPLIYEESTQGYLDGVFELEEIIRISLSTGILKDFLVTIYNQDGREVYFSGNPDSRSAAEDEFRARQPISFGPKTLQLVLQPAPGLYSETSMYASPLLLFGLALSLALATLLHLLLRRMELYRESRDLALHEVNEKKKVEASLREKEQKLERLLAEISEKNRELESFVYTVSHDLKTPIVTIEGFIGAFREDYGSTLTADGERYLKYMSDAARKMEVLIDDLLDLSRVGRIAEKVVELPFEDLVRSSLKDLRPIIDARGIKVEIPPGLPRVRGEKQRLGQVIDNLLTNAVKYIGKDNPLPVIEVGAAEQDGRQVFFVRDNGIGIEERYFDKIFQIFERLPAAKHAGEGTGIGLAIVKRIVEHHRGRIWLKSEVGKGTTFYFTLEGN